MQRTGARVAPGLPPITPPLWLRLSSVVLLVIVVAVQALTPDWVQLGFLIVATPALAALSNGPLVTSGVSLLVMGVMSSAPFVGLFPGEQQVQGDDLTIVLAVCLMSVLMAWVRLRYSARLVQVNTVAEAAQLAVLPELPFVVGGLRCAALYRAAERAALVGGDLYDVQDTSYGVRAMIGDVKGHGLDAVSTVAALLGTFREAVLDDADLERIGIRMERRMAWDNADRDEWSASFATAVFMEISHGGRRLRFSTHGHPPPLLLRGEGVRELSARPNPPLGLGTQLTVTGELATVELRAGDILLGYTDGVTETRNGHGVFYPLAERLTPFLAGHPSASPVEVTAFVWRDLNRFAGRLNDDVALLALKVP